MTSSFFSGIYSFFNSVSKLWQKEPIKRRRRDSLDEDSEDDDLLFGCQTLSKRPKWMNSQHPTRIKMASDDTQLPHSSTRRKVPDLAVKVPVKKSFSQRLQPGVKENGGETTDVESECINISTSSISSIETRPPLSDLSVRPKTKPHHSPADIIYLGSSRHTSHQNHVHDRRKNGVHPSLMNISSSSRLSKSSHSTLSRQTSLDEIFQIDAKLQYSQMLESFHKSSINCATSETSPSRRIWAQPTLNMKQKTASGSKQLETIDLTGEERKRTYIKVKPYPARANGGINGVKDEVNVWEEVPRQIERVNSLEKKLSQNCLVSPQWIKDMQQKYNEKERERLRQMEEEKLKKELYAKHNQSRRLEALDARIRNHLKITDVVLDDTEDILELPEITSEMDKKIDAALVPNPSSEILVEGFGQRITRKDIQTLNRLNWLNDEVINFYLNLIIERGKGDKKMSVYAFDTFFYPKLVTQGFNSLKRWTKKVDIFDKKLLLVPIHLGMHWCMATVDFRDLTVRYYDSMGGDNNRCLNTLLQYLNDESSDKKKKAYDTSKWKKKNIKDIPQQMNGSDCGMFSCMFAEYLSRNAKITFTQRDMPYFRRKMVYEIITKKLLMQ